MRGSLLLLLLLLIFEKKITSKTLNYDKHKGGWRHLPTLDPFLHPAVYMFIAFPDRNVYIEESTYIF